MRQSNNPQPITATALFILSLHCCCFRKVILLSKIYCFSVSFFSLLFFFFFFPFFTSIGSSAETPSFFKFTKSSVTITSFQRFTKPQKQTQKKKKKKLTCTVATHKEEDTDREESIFSLLKKMNKEEDIPVKQW